MDKQTGKFFLTTSIIYTNAPPHLGHTLEWVIADTIARYQRLRGREVFFLSGTDEHGVTNARAAERAGIPVQEFVDRNVAKVQALMRRLNIAHSDFIRTSDQKRHWPGAQKLWKRLAANGDFEKRMYQGRYCAGHEAFVTQKDLDQKGNCKDHGTAPEHIEEENYFFKLSRYAAPLKEAIAGEAFRILPESKKNEALGIIAEGLEDVSFSRPAKDIFWGIPVPGDPTQTMYVWCDALVNYISALGYGSDDELKMQTWWPADAQVIGKDILRFHALFWPAMLLAAGIDLPKLLLVHGHITVDGLKMSKTMGNVVDPFALIGRYGADAVRFYLTHHIATFDDGDFTDEKFHNAYESYLVNGLGNYVSRVTAMAVQYFGGEIMRPSKYAMHLVPVHLVPGVGADESSKTSLEDIIAIKWKVYHGYMETYQQHHASELIWHLIGIFDRYIQDYEPFTLIKKHKERTRAVLWNLCNGLAAVGRMVEPFLPETAKNIFSLLGIAPDDETYEKFTVTLPATPLFPRKKQ